MRAFYVCDLNFKVQSAALKTLLFSPLLLVAESPWAIAIHRTRFLCFRLLPQLAPGGLSENPAIRGHCLNIGQSLMEVVLNYLVGQ